MNQLEHQLEKKFEHKRMAANDGSANRASNGTYEPKDGSADEQPGMKRYPHQCWYQ